ncbi:hypothetical protein [Herminiimonas contaminans]|uniref:Uncharacterized protein n=1 Tax=Herminiimonas contaminans TaxID=1111140 RepID=A0ABS0EV59_9BURK|nr:hypothetical protein [Herminiimonas contaminans]MBF8177722.1 hypothetical protein [Herminiimonas contaminans]
MKTGAGGFLCRQEGELRTDTEEKLQVTRRMQQFMFDRDGIACVSAIRQLGLVQQYKIGSGSIRHYIDAVFEFVGQPIEMIIAP